jgi:hypothetical protein
LRLTPEEAAREDARWWLHRLQTRNRGGRPEDPDNQKLLEGADAARRRGETKWDFYKRELREKRKREPTPDDVKVVARRLERKRKKSLK